MPRASDILALLVPGIRLAPMRFWADATILMRSDRCFSGLHPVCGLDGTFANDPALVDWTAHSRRLSNQIASAFPTSGGVVTRSFCEDRIHGFRLGLKRGKTSSWVLIGHPLWNWPIEGDYSPQIENILTQALGELRASEGTAAARLVDVWDTFNLERRQLDVRKSLSES